MLASSRWMGLVALLAFQKTISLTHHAFSQTSPPPAAGAIIFESGALHNGNLAGFTVAGGIAALYAQGIDAVFAGLIHDLTSFPQKR